MSENKEYLVNDNDLELVNGGTDDDELFNLIKKVLASNLGVSANSIHLHSSIIDDLGADSLDVVDIVNSIAMRCQVNIDDKYLEKIKSVDDLCNLFRRNI